MKSLFILAFLSFYFLGYSQSDSKIQEIDSVELIEKWDNFFRYQNYYLSAQPELEQLKWLKGQGITKVINLRTKEENNDFRKESFNEKREVKSLGMDYVSIPIGGSEDYTPENLDLLIGEINPGDKVLIHCRSAGRANNFFMAYLIKAENMDVNYAVDIGKQIRFSLPFEDILGVDIQMEIISF